MRNMLQKDRGNWKKEYLGSEEAYLSMEIILKYGDDTDRGSHVDGYHNAVWHYLSLNLTNPIALHTFNYDLALFFGMPALQGKVSHVFSGSMWLRYSELPLTPQLSFLPS